MTGNLELVRLLVERRANVNIYGAAPLTQAVKSKEKELVTYLIHQGANIHAETAQKTGWTALHSAYSDANMIRLLLDHESEIDANSRDGTVLYLAVWSNYLDSVKLLIQRGADIEARMTSSGFADQGYTPLLAAAKRGHAEVFRLLLEAGAKIDARGVDNRPMLHHVVHSGKDNMLEIALQYNLALDETDDEGNTALHFATTFLRQPDHRIRRLVNRGASLDVPNLREYTALCSAIEAGGFGLAEFLISKSANVNVSPGGKTTPLHLACSSGNVEVVKRLVSSGARVDAKVEARLSTPLQVA
ncbi:ankyrin, partial [Thozetella sp. PMI_491]